jgi:hypothetical protein
MRGIPSRWRQLRHQTAALNRVSASKSTVSAVVQAVIPDFLTREPSFVVVGTKSTGAGGKIVPMEVDESRVLFVQLVVGRLNLRV